MFLYYVLNLYRTLMPTSYLKEQAKKVNQPIFVDLGTMQLEIPLKQKFVFVYQEL